jgi:hypothetical protein
MKVIKRALNNQILVNKVGQPMTITVIVMYKAQVVLYIEYIEKEFYDEARQCITI